MAGSLHCVGMCGPIALALPVGGLSPIKATLARLTYNVGRIASYSALGLLFGTFGKGLFVAGFQQKVSVLAGLLLLLMFIPARFWHFLSFQSVITRLKMHLGKQLRQRSFPNYLLLGMLNGLLPCGFVYLGLAGALATATPTEGAAYMALFGLGTTPSMLSISTLASWASARFRSWITRWMPAFGIILALVFILRGMNLGVPYLSPHFEKYHEIPLCHSTTLKR
mgnify:CR=1 FL=1